MPVLTNPLVRDPAAIIVAESFTPDLDGFWYPKAEGVPLVRIALVGDEYRIERRRKPATMWMPLVTANRSEFDPVAFRTWAASWPLVAN